MVTSQDEARRLLGIGPAADAGDIRRAYRRLARRLHPDAGGDAAAFHELQAALDLLLRPVPREPSGFSPSTSRTTRPSTDVRFGDGWGESTTRRWHDGPVPQDDLDWSRPLPDPPHAWDRASVAVAAATPLANTIVHPVVGVSRRPGSRLNRFSHWVAGDLMATWRIQPSPERGVPGHDVEIRFDFPPGKARRRADETRFPLGWSRLRRPDTTTVTFVLPPSPDRRITALRAASHLEEALTALEWPLHEWYRQPGE